MHVFVLGLYVLGLNGSFHEKTAYFSRTEHENENQCEKKNTA